MQNQVFGAWQSNPLVVDGVMYLTQRPNDVMAVDAKTGSLYWLYRHTPSADAKVCCGANNRGVAILGDTVFMGTLDARLIAIDAVTGKARWNIEVGDVKAGYSITMAPLVVKDKVMVGVGGGEYGIRGYVAAYDAKTGKEAWKFYTIPGPGEPGHDTWEGDDWKTGGAPAWVTGSYDPALNLVYWGIGNPGPDWNPEAAAGRQPLRRFRHRPRRRHGQVEVAFPVHAQRPLRLRLACRCRCSWTARGRAAAQADAVGQPQRLLLRARPRHRRVPVGHAVREGQLGERPRREGPAHRRRRSRPGQPTYPGNQGGTNWYLPGYSPRTGLFYFSAWENYGTIYRPEEAEYKPGQLFTGGGFSVVAPAPGAPTIGIGRRGPINNWTDEVGNGAVMAMDPDTGQVKWKLRQHDVSDAGMLTTATDLLFTGGREGHFMAHRREDRRAAVEGEPGRPDRDGPGHLHGGGQAVRVGDCRPARS